MRLILVRHAEAAHDAPYARRLAQLIADEIAAIVERTLRVEAVYSSPAPPAITTARVITQSLSLPPPVPHDAFVTVPDGASLDAVETLQSGAWPAVESLQEQHSPDCTLVLVGDEPLVCALVCRALNIPLADRRRFRIDPASLTTLDFRVQPQRRIILAGLNEICYIRSDK